MNEVDKILEEYPSLKNQYEQMKEIDLLSLFFGKDKTQEAKKIKEKFEDLILTIDEYNKNFSKQGWIAYENINVPFIKEANRLAKEKGITAAENYIADYYLNVAKDSMRQLMYSCEEFKKRNEMLKKAFEAYINEDFYFSIPIFLIIADGVVNEYTKNKGFFTSKIDLDCWDCLVGADYGLKKLNSIYNTSRRATTTEEIKMPYRNGILHGRDINFANKFVAGKCVVLLHAISEWIRNKNSESVRKEKYEKEINPPSIRESIEKLKEIEQDKEEMKKWKSQDIKVGIDIPIQGGKEEYIKYPWIYEIVETMELWKSKNYGALSKKLELLFNSEPNEKLRPKRCRELFENKELINFEIISTNDKSIAMKNVEIKVDIKTDKNETGVLKFNLIYENEKYKIGMPSRNNGYWRIYPVDVRLLY